MFAIAVLAVLVSIPVPQAGPGDLEVSVSVFPESPVEGEPVKVRTHVKFTGKGTVELIDGLRMRAPDVFVAEVRGKSTGEYSRVDRGRDGGPAYHKIVLVPGGTYVRHDVLSDSLKSGAPVFAKAGTYRLKVRFQGVESKAVTVTVLPAEASESEALKTIHAGKLHRYWRTIPEKEEYRPEAVEELKAFLEKHAASRFRPLAAFALARYWMRFDDTIAAKETPEETTARRDRILVLFADGAKAPVIATECDAERGSFHFKQKNGKSALEFLESAVKKGDAQQWIMERAETLLRDLKKKKEAGDPSIDWTR